jgi:hydroxymethylpyrimidine/phosphomethylpyrimidine kinase
MNKTILSISAFDSSCATGIAADLKTFQTFRVYGAGVATAILARNTLSIQAIQPIPMEIVGQQLEAVVSDLPIHGVKIGVLATAGNAQIVAALMETFQVSGTVVVHPVLQSSMGQKLLEDSAVPLLRDKIIPLATVVTPNRHEAEVLSGVQVTDVPSAKEAARVIQGKGCKHVVLTGGDMEGSRALDIWYDGSNFHLFDAPKLATRNTLGIGSTFSSILCALLAKGAVMGEAIDKAKKYLAKAVQHPFQIGKGEGPLNHTIPM